MIRLLIVIPAPADLNKQNEIATDTFTGVMLISVPIILLLIVIGYRKFKAEKLRQQIAYMERIWLLNERYK
jgi:hypothetical protein